MSREEREAILALRNIITAWDAHAGGKATPASVEKWLNETMRPAINEARLITGQFAS